MTHVHRVEKLANLGKDPLEAMSEMVPEQWWAVEVFAEDDRIMWTVENGFVTLHYREASYATQSAN